ncbi:MAG: HEPN domain-containing protein [Thermodesulfobacteriota bacterium]
MNDDFRKRELCHYRLQQANDALSEMDVLKNAGHIRGAINRAYYAMFYAIQALVVYEKAKVSKHSGAIAFFDKAFVKTGIFDKRFSKWLHRLFDLRQDADYGDMFEPTEEQSEVAAEQAREFVDGICTYLENYTAS